MLVLVIHLQGATHREANVATLLKTFSDFDARVQAAVRGGALSASERAKWLGGATLEPAYPFLLNDGEIGCFLSHRLAWQALLDSDHEGALILEDDAMVDRPLLDAALATIGDRSFMQLQTRPLKSGKIGLVTERPVPLRTTGQWLARAAAERLLDLTETIDRPVDSFLQMTWHHKLSIASAYPSGVTEAPADISSSTIQGIGKKGFWQELHRSLKRAQYRRRVSSLSARS